MLGYLLKNQTFYRLVSVIVATYYVCPIVSAGAFAKLADDIKSFTGSRTKIVWAKAVGNVYEADLISANYELIGFDTYDGIQRQILPGPASCANPWITPNGERVVFSSWTDTMVYIVNWNGSNKKILMKGFALCVWGDPADGKEWVYVSDKPYGSRIVRYQIDDTSRNELVWDKTDVSIRFRVSADGTRGGGEFPWPKAGEVTLPNGTFTSYGSGCNSSMAPNNSYRFFNMIGSHKEIVMCDDGPNNQRTILFDKAPGIDSSTAWIPKWSNDVRFFTMAGPTNNPNVLSNIILGAFNTEFTDVDRWLQITGTSDSFENYAYAWIGGVPQIEFNPRLLNFAIAQDGSGILTESVTVSSSRGALPLLTASPAASWLSVQVTGVGYSQLITNTVVPENMESGIYKTTVSVSGVGIAEATYDVAMKIDGQRRLKSLSVTPHDVAASVGDTIAFKTTGVDQFGESVDAPFLWSATGGSISDSGVFIAGNTTGNYTVTAKSLADSSIKDLATVTIYTGLVVLAPKHGMRFAVGDTMYIKWISDIGELQGVIIEISPDNGKKWVLINGKGAVTRDDLSWGNYPWIVANSLYDDATGTTVSLVSDHCIVRVRNYTAGALGMAKCDSLFTITEPLIAKTQNINDNGRRPAVYVKHGRLELSLPVSQTFLEASVIDLKGKCISQAALNSRQQRYKLTNSLAPGTYIVRLQTTASALFIRTVVK